MYKILRADKDTYITNRVVNGVHVTDANVGAANTLDLFKLYGYSFSGSLPNTELSRILIHFNLDPIRDLITAGKISIDDPSFSCTLVLKDVYGGQSCPSNFTMVVNALADQFDEGLGRDVAQYSDIDVCNFLTASIIGGAWAGAGCSSAGVDYYSAPQAGQLFETGFENLSVNVTPMVTASIKGDILDAGFRVALDSSLEADQHTYFVKRFGARSVFDKNCQPELIVKFDDSVQDDTQIITLDDDYTLFLYSYSKGVPSNLKIGATQITGSNSLILRLNTAISGGFHDLVFSASQYSLAGNPVTGVYTSTINIPSSDPIVAQQYAQTGSYNIIPIWSSLDGATGFVTASLIQVPARDVTYQNMTAKTYIITCQGLRADMFNDEMAHIRVTLFDDASNLLKASRRQTTPVGVVVRDAYYSIRDVDASLVVIPFDTVGNSTRLSSDKDGMWFNLDTSNLFVGHRYVIDVKTIVFGQETMYADASPAFRIRIH